MITTEDKLKNTHFPWEVKRLACALWFVSGTLPCVASHFSLTFPVRAQAEEYCCSLSLQCLLHLPQCARSLHLHHPNYFLLFLLPWKLQPIFYHALKPTYDLELSYQEATFSNRSCKSGRFLASFFNCVTATVRKALYLLVKSGITRLYVRWCVT